MRAVPIPFPPSSSGGAVQYASGGRIVNAMAQQLTGSSTGLVFIRAPGLRTAFDALSLRFRGALEVDDGCYIVLSNACYYVTYSSGYTATKIGSIPGSQAVTLAANNRAPDKDVLCVCEFGIFTLTTSSVAPFTDADLPATGCNSVVFVGGYLVLSYSTGRMHSSGVNDTTFGPLDFATAESQPDSLLRVIRRGRELIAFGSRTVEFWTQNTEVVAFPFSFQTATKGGIVGTHAITGWEPSLPADVPLFYVSVDNTVKAGTGYTFETVSTLDVQRDIAAEADKTAIRMSSFVNDDGCVHVVLHLTNATWVFDWRHKAWHERASYGRSNWRVAGAFSAFGKWLAGDSETGRFYEISASVYDEAGSELIFEVESGPSKSFPGHFTVKEASFDFAPGQGFLPWASEPERNPQVMIQWSDDGGNTWSSALQRELGQSGQYNKLAKVSRCGRARAQGRRWRIRVSDPVPVALLGGMMEVV